MGFEKMTHDQMIWLDREWSQHGQFCQASLTVEAENSTLVPMVPSIGQAKLNDAIARIEATGRPVRIIYLKSRRIRATTATASQFFQRTAFRAGQHTVVIAHDETSVQNIFRTYRRFHDSYKPFHGLIHLPSSRTLGDRIYYEYGDDPESSFIQIHTSGNAAFGRSFRITNVHFSEFPYYKQPAATLGAVMSAVPKLPGTCAVIEGTAKTIGDDFQSMWQEAIDPAGHSEWAGLFLGWTEHPTNRMPLHVPADRFQETLSRDERELMARKRLDLEQLAWRRYTIANDFNGNLSAFKREHPADPEEAFASSGRNRFSIPDIDRFQIIRDPMLGELEVRQVGLETKPTFFPNPHGSLAIFRLPQPGRDYVIGADCSQGIDVTEGTGKDSDPDYTVFQVVDRDTLDQVARLRARLMPGASGRYLAMLGQFYNMAQICGERNPGGGGIAMLEAVLNADYPSILLYHRSAEPDRDPQIRGDRLGWDTSGVSRPILLSLLDDAIRLSQIHVHDAVTKQELQTFVIKSSGKAEAQGGCHDDTVIALALSLIAITRMPRPLKPKSENRPGIEFYGARARRDEQDRRGERLRLR